MKQNIYIKIVVLLSFILNLTITAQAQYEAESFVFPEDYNGPGKYTASNFVRLIPEFNYSANQTDNLNLTIDPFLIAPPSAGTTGGPNGGNGVVGLTDCNFTVSPTGAALFSMPLHVAPGMSGMTPEIALTYNNQGTDGPMGKGWDITGISAITRGASTYYYNGHPDAVNFSDDQYLKDGNKLIWVNNQSKFSNEYRTEVNGFAKILYHSGEDYFVEYTKSGLIIEYGNTQDSRFVTKGAQTLETPLIWYINKISDHMGNSIHFTYNQSFEIGETVISRIQYTYNNSKTVNGPTIIDFEYELKSTTKHTKAYYLNNHHESHVCHTKRLKNIKVKHNNNVIRKYVLDYIYGNTNLTNEEKFLNKITEFDGEGNQFNSLVFNWQHEEMETRADHELLGQAGYVIGDRNYMNFGKGDFDGDGIDELLSYAADDLAFYRFDLIDIVAEELESESYPYTISNINTFESCITINYDYDLNDEFLLVYHDHIDLINWVENSGTYSFETTQIISDCDYSEDKGSKYPMGGEKPIFADFNADGLIDIIYKRADGGSGKKYTLRIRNGDGTLGSALDLSIQADEALQTGDFDGDGQTDLLVVTFTGGGIYYFNTTHNTFEKSIFNYTYLNNFAVHTGDLNGDGKTDIFFPSDDNSELNVFFFAGENQYKAKTVNNLAGGYEWLTRSNMIPCDVNGNGRLDFIYCDISDGSYYSVYITQPDGLNFTKINIRNPNYHDDPGKDMAVGDFTGNGNIDVISTYYEELQGSGYNVMFWLAGNWGAGDNAVNHFSNSLGAGIKISYNNLDHFEGYSVTESASYPIRMFKSDLNIVSKVERDNGIGGYFPETTYEYDNGIVHLRGKGFIGFKEIRTFDENQQSKTVQKYDINQSEYYFHKPTQTLTSVKNDEDIYILINKTESEYLFKVTHPAGPLSIVDVFFPYADKTLEYQYENDGSLTSVTKTLMPNFDDYGNPLKIETQIGTNAGNLPFKTITNQIYDNDEYDWILGRLTGSFVTYISPNNPNIVRNSAFSYYEEGSLWYGMLKTETVEPGHEHSTVKTYHYDDYGNAVKTVLTAGTETPREAETIYHNGHFVDYTLNAKDQKTDYFFEETWGNLISVKDANDLITTFEYDGFNRKYRTNYPDGNNKSIIVLRWADGHSYAPAHAVYYTWQHTTGSMPVIVFFDKLQRKLRDVTYGDEGKVVFIDYHYDSKGRLYKQTDPYFKASGVAYNNNFYYDNLNRLTKVYTPGNRKTEYIYNGLTTIVKNALNQTGTKTVNAAGLLIESKDNNGKSVSYDYNSDGSLKYMFDPHGNRTEIYYDDLRRKTKLIDPGMGTTEYTYTAYSELYSQTRNGEESLISTEYDEMGRVTERHIHEGITSFLYDTKPNGIGMIADITMAYNDDYGNVVDVSRSYKYDHLSRISNSEETVDGQTFTVEHTYNSHGKPESLTYPSGYSVNNSYDSHGFLDRITDNQNNTVWESDSYDAKGHLLAYYLGGIVKSEKEYDPVTGDLLEVRSGISEFVNNELQFLQYEWDAVGNLSWRKDENRGLREVFSYDNLNRLTTIVTEPLHKIQTIAYDDLGNITYKSDVGTYNYDGPNPYAVTSIDENPALISDLDQAVNYNSFNKTANITENDDVTGDYATLKLAYGIEYQRVRQEIRDFAGVTTTKYYLNGLYEKEIKSKTTKETHYVNSPAGLVATYVKETDKEDIINYILKDHLGSIHCILDKDGNLTEEFSFDAWGLRRDPNTHQPFNPNEFVSSMRGFTGHEHLDLFALVNMNGRVYDPTLGRFLSADPVIQAPDFTQSLNRYSYCLNNPLKYTDPSGYKFKDSKFAKFLKKIAAPVITFAVAAVLTPVIGPVGAAVVGGFAGNFLGTLINGGNMGEALISGVKGAFIGGLTANFGLIGKELINISGFKGAVIKAGFHGTTQGIIRKTRGGNFFHGFVAGAAGSLAGSATGSLPNYARVTIGAIAGGSAEKLGGGKFINGAQTGAFVVMYGHLNNGNSDGNSGHIQKPDINVKPEINNSIPSPFQNKIPLPFQNKINGSSFSPLRMGISNGNAAGSGSGITSPYSNPFGLPEYLKPDLNPNKLPDFLNPNYNSTPGGINPDSLPIDPKPGTPGGGGNVIEDLLSLFFGRG